MIFFIRYFLLFTIGLITGAILNKYIYKLIKAHCSLLDTHYFTQFFMATICTCLYYWYGLSLNFIKYMFFFAVLIVIAIIDFKTTWIYTNTIITGVIGSILFLCYEAILGRFWNFQLLTLALHTMIPALLGGGIILVICVTTRAMGYGDSELFFLCGMYLSISQMLFLLISAFIVGGLVGFALIIFKGKKYTDYIPFAPVILTAAIITVLYGDLIMHWYMLHT